MDRTLKGDILPFCYRYFGLSNDTSTRFCVDMYLMKFMFSDEVTDIALLLLEFATLGFLLIRGKQFYRTETGTFASLVVK